MYKNDSIPVTPIEMLEDQYQVLPQEIPHRARPNSYHQRPEYYIPQAQQLQLQQQALARDTTADTPNHDAISKELYHLRYILIIIAVLIFILILVSLLRR